MSEKILITGATGLLGSELLNFFNADYDCVGVGSKEFDIRNKRETIDYISTCNPNVVLNCAAWTNVDACENDPDNALAINAEGAGNVAEACGKVDATLIHYSTDYVFDGAKEVPYVEDDQCAPVNVYGQSKLKGEKLVLECLPEACIMRVAWLYSNNPKSLIVRLISEAREKSGNAGKPFRMVSDQIGTPTWTIEVARQTKKAIDNKFLGIVHCTAQGACSRYDFAKLLFNTLKIDAPIIECSQKDFADKAPRPKYTPLSNAALDKAGIDIMQDYGAALMEFLSKYYNK